MGVILRLFAIAGVVGTTSKSVMAHRTMRCVLDLAVHCSHITCISVDTLKFVTDDPDLRTGKNRMFNFRRAFQHAPILATYFARVCLILFCL